MPLWLAVRLGIATLANHAVAIGRAATGNHHVAVLNLGHACHAARHLLKAFAMRGAKFGQEINIATQGNGTVQVGSEYSLFLILRHWPLIQIGALIGFEAFAVFGLHQ